MPLSQMMTLNEVCRALPPLDGRKLHPSTVWRWCRSGVAGVRLPFRRIGRRLVIDPADLERFTLDVAAASLDPQSRPAREPVAPRDRSPEDRARAAAEAESELAASGW